MEFDVYLVQRVDGRRPHPYVGKYASHIGTVTVNPEIVPFGATPLDHAIELIATQTPRIYNHED